ncbi:TetR family transcriptional regulator [Amycolatopsis sp. CA-230715]|uniref:TetR family transcriptional regulator n=1 Tax=Amycolatopsis sp. CA-230715 TaxID=2745196 RepID=UPI001C01B80A|nr:TetR family transcriptional regulator [Amycolatopsis sp. CA-230715]QWF85782.1 hypothetical protein HUW46_09262 [Amycolatopsis sp. CA-230715]
MRDTIVRVAHDLFADRGANVTLDEIAATVGITTPYLQTYFTSIDEVRAATRSLPSVSKGGDDVRPRAEPVA